MSGLGRGLKLATAGIAAIALVLLSVPLTANAAAPSWTTPPTRLYMLPTENPGTPPPGAPSDVPQLELLFDDGTDPISGQNRTLNIESAEQGCSMTAGNNYDFSGCTAVQFSVSNGTLSVDDSANWTEVTDNAGPTVRWQLPDGAFLRDFTGDPTDPGDYPLQTLNLIGTTTQLNLALDTIKFTPDDGYNTFDNGNATLSAIMVPGNPMMSSASIDIELKVLNWNAFPEITRPAGPIGAASGAETELGVDADWAFDDDDNNENDGDGHLDGPNSEFLMAAWVSCGLFTYLPAAGFTTYTDTEAALASYIGAPADPLLWSDAQTARVAAMEALLPAAVLAKNGSWANNASNSYHAAHLSIVDQWDDVEYALQNITFNAIDAVTSDPIDNTTCQLNVYVTDLGNNGLPTEYVIPPEDADPLADDDPYEVPTFGYDLVTNGGNGIEQLNITVGEPEIELTLSGDTTLAEGASGNLSLAISPAQHGPFTVSFTTIPVGAVPGTDYTQVVFVNVPENATSVQVPIDALDDMDVDPGESYTVVAQNTVPGYTVTLVDPNATVLITDTDVPVDVTSPTATVGQAAGQLDPTSFLPIIFTIVFSEPVTGFGDSGSDISFVGSTAGGVLGATFSGSGDTYQVEVSGAATNGLVKLSIPEGAALDAANNPSEAAIPGDNSVQYIKPNPGDNTPPSVTINQAVGQVDPATVPPVVFDVVFSEPVVGLDSGDITLSGTALPTTAAITGSGTTYQVLVSGMSVAGTVSAVVNPGAAFDALNNASIGSTSTDATVTWQTPSPGSDLIPPTVTVNRGASQPDVTSTSPIVFDVLFSEQVVGFDATDVTIGGSALPTGVTVSGIGPAYQLKVTGMSVAGEVTAGISANMVSDAVGNPNAASTSTDNSVTWQLPAADVTPPSGTINQALSQADPTTIQPIKFAVKFSEAVTGLTASDIQLSGTAPGASVLAVNGSGDTYEVVVGNLGGAGTVVVGIGGNAVKDLAGNDNVGLTSTDNTVTFNLVVPGDVTGPTPTLHYAPGQLVNDNTSPVLFQVDFDEEVAGFGAEDISLGGSAIPTAVVVTGSGAGPYLLEVSGMITSGTVVVGVLTGGMTDASNNPSNPPVIVPGENLVNFTFTADNDDPTVTINRQVAATATSPVVFDVVFNETVVDFDASDLTIGGTAGATSALVSGTGPAYTVAVSGMTLSGTVVLSLAAGKVHDESANLNEASTGSNSVAFTLDTTPPTVTVNLALGQESPTAATTVAFTVEFSEAVTGFDSTDISFTGSTAGGTLAATITPVDAVTYTVEVTGMATPAGNVVIGVLANSVVDVANLANAASGTASVAWDDNGPLAFSVQPPNVSVQAAQGDSGANVTFPLPTATGGVEPVTVTCDYASGDFFPIGTTTVTCTATDSAEIQTFALVMTSFDVIVTAAPATPGLAVTGAAAAPLIVWALMLLLGGAVTLVMVRRRTA